MGKRIGVFICHCGHNIAGAVDIETLRKRVEKIPDVVFVTDYRFLCSSPGQELLGKSIVEHKLDAVVTSHCSPTLHERTFRNVARKVGLNPYRLEVANIREQVSWPHWNDHDAATKKAFNVIRATIEKVKRDLILDDIKVPITRKAMVIGGGVTGIQTALDIADGGYEVYLVEKDPSIGGKMIQLSETFPTLDCPQCILTPKMTDVANHPNIHLMAYSEVVEINGYVGNFAVKIKHKASYVDNDKCIGCGACSDKCPSKKTLSEFDRNLGTRPAIYTPFAQAVPNYPVIDAASCIYFQKGKCRLCEKVCPTDAIDFEQKDKVEEIEVGAIVAATGFELYPLEKIDEYGAGKIPDVVDGLQFERLLASSGPTAGVVRRRSDGKIPKSIAFVQCARSRDPEHGMAYCSRICCMYATKLSQLLKRSDPTRDVYVFYTDLRAYGKGFEEYYKRAQRTGVKFIRGRVAELIEDSQTRKLTLRVEDTLTRQIIESEFDLVVLSVGLRPNEGTDRIANLLRLAKSPDGFLQEAHPKFRPVDTLTDGVFLAGTVQGPKDIPDTVAQASAASARATRLMNRGEYDVEPVMAFVHEESCDGCGLCVEQCPTNAISLSSRDANSDKSLSPKVAEINEALCKGCGSCIAYCPKDALDLHCYSNDQLLAQIKAVLADKKNGEVRVLVFADDMTTYRLADNVGVAKMSYSLNSRIIRVPSGSRVTPKLMLQAFAEGADGIFIGECEEKSSPYPHSVSTIKSNISKVTHILKEEGIDEKRLRFVQFVTVMLGGFVNNINSLSDFTIKSGPIPAQKRKRLGENINERLFK